MTRGAVSRRKLPPLFRAVVAPLQAFFRLEAASGIVLGAGAVVALVLANTAAAPVYFGVVSKPVRVVAGPFAAELSLLRVVDDGLMTVFFFLVGMEIKREIARGELASLGRALLPAVAALGGMLVPAALYLAWNPTGPGRAGWGIPMATDIAFTIGCLTLLGRRVPQPLQVFVTALAIFDDIGGIVVIALFYGHGLDAPWIAATAGVGALLWIVGRRRPWGLPLYLVGGAALWLALGRAGIHATIAGVILGFLVPAGPDDRLDRFVDAIHPWVAFGIMPLFALTNAGVSLGAGSLSELFGPVALGSAVGLFAGKQVGVFAFTRAATALGLAPSPGGASSAKLYGVAMLAGIGFTVALFIAQLAFSDDPALLMQAKLGILVGSALSGLGGSLVLRATPRLVQP
jgi:Na+:H+ antiporter, NhaA family